MDMPIFSVDGKIAIITGGSQGIGRMLALGFAKSGASVVLVARTVADLETVANEVEIQGGKALVVPTDVTKSDQVSQMVHKTVKAFGHIDILVNCAGGGIYEPLLDISEESWDFRLDYNLKSVYLCCRAVGKVMVEQGSGNIINFSTGGAVTPSPGLIHYCAAKAGVDMLTRTLAAEWGRFNVRVNAISPGLTNTKLTWNVMGPDTIKQFTKTAPLGRIAEPEDFIGLAIFLASEASSYITGAIIPVNGGPQGNR
ncbi:SDR family NAD(P)-dependent oxidoreductase [Chloroflexota bacterium]